MAKAPEFKDKDIKTLRQRAGEMCSRCKKTTSQSHSDFDKSVTLGESAHIRAARLGEARFTASMTDEERGHIANGIWMCRPCHKTIDSDENLYTIGIVQALKDRHEVWILEGKPNLENARKKTRILECQGQTVGQLNGSRPKDVQTIVTSRTRCSQGCGSQPACQNSDVTTAASAFQGDFTLCRGACSEAR